MKTKSGILSMAFTAILAIFTTVNATPNHNETATFKVYGNCEMCKKRIEAALLKNESISSATWDVKTKMVTIVYNPHMISLDAIHQIIADAGHDTEILSAKDSTYKDLMGCCQYKRKK